MESKEPVVFFVHIILSLKPRVQVKQFKHPWTCAVVERSKDMCIILVRLGLPSGKPTGRHEKSTICRCVSYWKRWISSQLCYFTGRYFWGWKSEFRLERFSLRKQKRPTNCTSKRVGRWFGFGELHPWKLTWHWKITIFNRQYIFKWWVFHCYVSFRWVIIWVVVSNFFFL